MGDITPSYYFCIFHERTQLELFAFQIQLFDNRHQSFGFQTQIHFDLNCKYTKTHYSFLFITHDVRLARLFCDEIILLEAGKIVEKLTPPAAFTSPLGKQLDAAILR